MPLLTFPGVKVKPWSDKEIRAGDRWDQEIKTELAAMHVFVPLVSANFGASRYINGVECKLAKKRFGKGEIEIIPIYVAPPGGTECDWLMQFQRVPPGDKSWAETFREFQHYDFALAPIRDGIREVVERARGKLGKKGGGVV